MNFLNLNHELKSVDFKGDFSSSHPLIYEFFKSIEMNGSYDSKFEQALALGCYAMQTDQIGQTLDKISIDLNGELGVLKKLIEIRGLKTLTPQKGDEAEQDILDAVQRLSDEYEWGDKIYRTGSKTGAIPRSKIGDIVIELEGTDRKIVIESKLDGSVTLGDPSKLTSNMEKKTAYGQNVSSLANREADISIFVGDVSQSDASLVKNGRISFHPELPAFVVLADAATGDYSLVEAVYSLSRAVIYAWEVGEKRWEATDLIIGKVQLQIEKLNSIFKSIDTIESSANKILKEVAESKKQLESIPEEIQKIAVASKQLRDAPADALLKRAIYLGLDS